MNFGLLTGKSLRVFVMIGGWRTVVEIFASRIVYLVVYLLTGRVVVSALVAVGAVLVFAVVRVWTDRKWWQAVGGLVMVGVCASIASGTGQGVDFYLPSVVLPAWAGFVFLVSMMVRWPMIGVILGVVRGERFGWRRDRGRRRLYQFCTAVFLVKFVVNVAVLVPLYLAGQVVALGIASTLLGTPALGVCGYVCWRILRTETSDKNRGSMTDFVLTQHHHPFDPPVELAGLPAISPLLFASGVTGWVVTSPRLGREMLTDQRFSADRTFAESPLPGFKAKRRPGDEQRRAGSFITMDPPEHTRYRRLLTGQFTVRRVQQLEQRIGQIVDEHLDCLAQQGKPADLVTHFALPVPSLVICELMGVDHEDREEFQSFAKVMVNVTVPEQDRFDARIRASVFLRNLVEVKRTTPDNGLLSGLISESDLTDDELTNIAFLLLFAGHETTANMLGLGTFALLQHPAQLAKLRANPDLMPRAVEELMRYLSIIGPGIFRVATADLTLGGAEIGKGQTLVLATPTANRSSELTDRPDELDVTRERTHHLAFGHGIHQCLGQQLARVEMQVGFRRLFERFPDLALAVPADQVLLRTDMAIYGVHTLPVTW
jgi:cytochrome P450/uncharacterized membrane protein